MKQKINWDETKDCCHMAKWLYMFEMCQSLWGFLRSSDRDYLVAVLMRLEIVITKDVYFLLNKRPQKPLSIAFE